MLHANVHVTEDLAEWRITVVLTETYGPGVEPLEARAEVVLARTPDEWDADVLGAFLSVLTRFVARVQDDAYAAGLPLGGAID